jgi:hypothetical protein
MPFIYLFINLQNFEESLKDKKRKKRKENSKKKERKDIKIMNK